MQSEARMKKIIALGPKGTYGHQAAVVAQDILRQRGIEVPDILFRSRNEEILTSTQMGGPLGCFGIAPIENARAGLVREVVDFWLGLVKSSPRAEIFVVGEVHLPVRQCLLVHPSITDIVELEAVMSHPQALAQCAGRLEGLMFIPSLQIPSKSTAEAAEKIANDPAMRRTAAIASSFAAELYGLNVLEEGLEQSPGNETRFHILGAKPIGPTGNDRTAIIFKLPNKLGVLSNVLQAISGNRVNMSSIHSVPLGVMNGYAFYAELDCHMDSKEGKEIKAALAFHTASYTVLGSYPREVRKKA